MKKIVVLMSTYNGEKYIREQLESIIQQKEVDLTLLIRDDGSTDMTRTIISEYCGTYDNIHFINEDKVENLGFNRSFMTLIAEGLKKSECDYFAFADQDDIWFKDKLINALKHIEERQKVNKTVQNELVYYYANKLWSDENLNPLFEDNFNYCRDNYFDMFMLPPVYGCTSVISRKLAEKSLHLLNNDQFLYDVYIFRLNCLLNGQVISDRKPQMFYRRHGGNASGDAMQFSIIQSFKKYITGPNQMHGIKRYVSDIYKTYSEDMCDDKRKLCELIMSCDSSLFARMRLAAWKQAHTRGIKASAMWVGRVLLNAI